MTELEFVMFYRLV